MKTTKTLFAAITNTITLKEIVLMILFNIAFSCFGQQVKGNEEHTFEGRDVSEYKLTSFKCTSLEGKVYIMWTVLEPSNECIYVLERSTDNKNFYKIHFENGSKSPNNIELVNSYIDEKPLEGTSYYRVRRLIKGIEINSNVVAVQGMRCDYVLCANGGN